MHRDYREFSRSRGPVTKPWSHVIISICCLDRSLMQKSCLLHKNIKSSLCSKNELYQDGMDDVTNKMILNMTRCQYHWERDRTLKRTGQSHPKVSHMMEFALICRVKRNKHMNNVYNTNVYIYSIHCL